MRVLLFPAVALVALAACDTQGDTQGDAPPSIVGTYVATRYITPAPNDGPVDQLALGGSLELRLNADGTYAGEQSRVDIQVGPPGPWSTTTVDLTHAGTYVVIGDTAVAFMSASDTPPPVFQLDYNAQAGILADSVFGIGPYVLVLERQEAGS